MTLIFLSVLFIVMVSLRFMTTWPLIQREISDSVYTFSAFYIAESVVTQIFATVLLEFPNSFWKSVYTCC